MENDAPRLWLVTRYHTKMVKVERRYYATRAEALECFEDRSSDFILMLPRSVTLFDIIGSDDYE